MNSRAAARIGVLLAAAIVAHEAAAHHALAAKFDDTKRLSLAGIVTSVDWRNPHVHVFFNVTKADKSVENWAVEAGPPGTLIRAGFTKDSLAFGTVIKVNGFRAKDGALRANGRDITLPDGRLLFVGGSSPDAPK